MLWHRRGGPQALRDLRDLGHEPGPEDYPPALEWEQAVWNLFRLVSGQWRMSMRGAVGLDYGTVLPLIADRGWSADRTLPLLGAIEHAMLAKLEDLDDDPDDDAEDEPDGE